MSLGLGVGYYGLGGEDMASSVSTDLKQATSGVAAGLALWLKNDTGVTAAKWTDSSGYNNHATQSTEGRQADVSGGGLDFEEGQQDHYDLASKITIGQNGGFCLALVVTRESTAASAVLGDSANELIQFNNATTLRIKTTTGGNITTDAVFPANTFAAGSKFLFLVNRSAGASNRFSFFKNGAALTADTDTSSNEAAGENPNGFEISVIGSRD